MQNSSQILKSSGLSITEGRASILDIFLNSRKALSHAEIEKTIDAKFDRVSIYRTLIVFTEKGIIHQIPTTDNSVRYALCKEDCGGGHHHDEHVHFICTDCDQTICMNEVVVPKIKLPRGFRTAETAMVVKGKCDACTA